MNVIQKIRYRLFGWKLQKKIKQANKLKNLTGYKYLVLRYKNTLIVKSKMQIKRDIRKGKIKARIQDIEKIALYITR